MEKKSEKITAWIKEKADEAGAKGVIIGLSGGIDSSCVAVLCKRAFPDSTLGVIMPCFSSHYDLAHARILAEKFDIPYNIVNLEESFTALFRSLSGEEYDKEKHNNIASANLKPRLRMSALYYFANKLNCLVAGTDNKSEEMIGYFTKYGDGGVDILPIVGLFKKDVRKMAKHLGIPGEIIAKKPSAGLWDGQTDEDEMGLSYEELDEILEQLEKGGGAGSFDEEKVRKVKHMMKVSAHKREMPPGCKLD
ncbi:NAD(+) synthase [Candidatus Woesearchaeota archaeon]|nr:NAD(+) synthase [Candidatus Woesearchaeota archaeon]